MAKLKRLDQLLTSLGYGSRREAQGMVYRGQITVKGEVVDRPDTKVAAEDVQVKGQPLEAPEGLLAILHKPVGYICTHSDGEGQVIYDLLPSRWRLRSPTVTSVGRLDKDTSGALLITDQGNLVQRWTSPKSDVEKVYEVTVDKPLDASLVEIFASGTVMLRGEDKPCLPAKMEIVAENQAKLTLSEGRYHQVRRMFASQGWRVEALHRSRFGDFTLENLEPGTWRLLDLSSFGRQDRR